MTHFRKEPKDAQRIPDPGEHVPSTHPQRRRDDPQDVLYTSKRLRLANDRPVDFARPMGVVEARERYARERKAEAPSRLRKRVSDGYLVLGFALAGLAVAVVVVALAWALQ